jgi:hypothetical protein
VDVGAPEMGLMRTADWLARLLATAGRVRWAEFAENSELNSNFSPARTLRPGISAENAGETAAPGENLSANRNSEFFRRLSEFFHRLSEIFRRNSEFEARALSTGKRPAPLRRAGPDVSRF